jgi:type IV pilus assembly protein PilM
MAEIQTTVALNIGSQRISMAIFELSKAGGLVLRGYDSESLLADPAMEAGRIAQVRVAISDLYARLKPGKVRARYAISGQAVFTRFVRLPPLKDENVEQLVTFEAQQHVPFPLNEVVWDYELIEGAADKEGVIVAIKSDALDEINDDRQRQRAWVPRRWMWPRWRSTTRFTPHMGCRKSPPCSSTLGPRPATCCISKVGVFSPGACPSAGFPITAAIAKEYGVSFAEAEYQKVNNGLVALGGGHTEQLEERWLLWPW